LFRLSRRLKGVRGAETLDPTRAYALWAPTYAPEAHNPLMRLEERAVLELLPDLDGRTALDLGCGTGRYLALLRARGARRAFGLDRSWEMLREGVAARRDPAESPALVQGDLLTLPLATGAADLIVCGLAIGHVAALDQAIAEASRVLRPGGVVIYSDFHPFGALTGWQRTFRAPDGRVYAVAHHIHLYADHHAACRRAGLEIEAVREPRIDVAHAWRGFPAVLVIRARKAG
jgi:malonyl-CoA O-methyltransferase